jgi:hypothetical protein
LSLGAVLWEQPQTQRCQRAGRRNRDSRINQIDRDAPHHAGIAIVSVYNADILGIHPSVWGRALIVERSPARFHYAALPRV